MSQLLKTEMTPACRALVDGVEHRAKRARRKAWYVPRTERQKFIYDTTYRNEIEAVAYPLAKTLGWIPDFANPETFVEIVRGLYLTHPNPLMSLAADKIEMRRYCDLFDLPIRPPELLATYDNPHDLDLAELPPTAMIKKADGCKMHILHGPGMPLTPFAYWVFLFDKWHVDHWRRHSELHYRDIPRRLLVEEALLPMRALKETQVFCAMGEPFIMAIPGGGRVLLNERLRPVQSEFTRPFIPLADVPQKRMIEDMIETAKRLAKPFVHCRVDFMQIENRAYLGEITLSPGALKIGYDSRENELLRTSLIDRARLPELVDQGRKLAAELGWPTDTSFGHMADDPRLSTGGQ